MLADQASPMSKGPRRGAVAAPAAGPTNARQTGSKINTVAVLLSHMLVSALASITPNSRRRPPPPIARSSPIASRACTPLCSIAWLRMKPPSSSRMRGWP